MNSSRPGAAIEVSLQYPHPQQPGYTMVYSNPAAAEDAFYAAFSALDAAAMRGVWTDDPAAYCLHPGGPALRGLDAIMESWSSILTAVDPPSISYRTVSRNLSGDIAVHLVEESIKPSASSSKPPSLVLATNIYVRDDDSWRLMVHHASLPLVESKSPTDTRALH